MHLLIVDDHPANLHLLRRQLESEGHTSLEATNGVEALKMLERATVDAVISDILMPDMDGFRLCLEIRKSAKHGALPVVLYTSTYDSAEDRQLAQMVGADRYIVKLSPPGVLFDALREAVQRTPDSTPPALPHNEAYVLKHYNGALVTRLEERNIELQQTLAKLQAANAEILQLNRDLESRVEQRTADLLAANRDLDSFSYSVSHDLRAPLRAIDGFSRIVETDYGDRLDDEGRRLLGVVRDNSRRMGQLIEHLLEFSRLGRTPLARTDIDMTRLAKDALEEARADAGRPPEVVVQPLPAARGDAALLRQVWINLLANAVKFSGARERPSIDVSGYESSTGNVYCVKDNGAGFDMRYYDKLFGVFQRLHSEREFAGSGVGLAIVQQIIVRHGGRVWAESVPGQGASFYFSLPGTPPVARGSAASA